MNFFTQPTTTASETTFLVVVVCCCWSCNKVNYCRWREHLNFVDDGRKIKKKGISFDNKS